MDTCVFCGGDKTSGPMNREHFIAKCFWSGKRPKLTKVVPAHKACNGAFATESETLRDILVAEEGNNHPEAVALRQGALHRKMRKFMPSFLRSIRNIGLRPFRTPSGTCIGMQPSFQATRGQFDRVLRHVARSCYCVIHGAPLAQTWTVGIMHGTEFHTPAMAEMLKEMGGWNTFGDDVFACRALTDTDRTAFFACLMRFYNFREYLALAVPPKPRIENGFCEITLSSGKNLWLPYVPE